MAAATTSPEVRYRLLEEILAMKNLPMQPMFSTQDVASIFGVTARAIHNRIAAGELVVRNLPGKARFLAQDIEDFILSSRKVRP